MRHLSFIGLAVTPFLLLGCSTNNKESRAEKKLFDRNGIRAPTPAERRRAKQGYAEDQYTLGRKYFELAKSKFDTEYSRGFEPLSDEENEKRIKLRVRIYEKAKDWLTKSAEQEYIPAQTALVQFYYSDQRRGHIADHELDKSIEYKMRPVWKKSYGLKKEDRDAAIKWCRRAADNGHVPSMFELGQLYNGDSNINRGLYTPNLANRPEAYKWFQKAADQGHYEAAYQIAFLYNTKRNEKLGYSAIAEADDIESYAWYTVAAELEKKANPKKKSRHAYSIDAVRKRLNEEQIKEGDEHAKNLLTFIAKKMAGK